MHKFFYKNQQLLTQTQAQISINERGYLFGDGIFETCLVRNHKIYDFLEHLKRLEFGLKNLKIRFDTTNLEEQCYKLITKNHLENAILKIHISRGEGNIGYAPKPNTQALLIITTQDLRPKPGNITLGISSYLAPSQYLGKTTNSLTYVLTKIEAAENNHFDCVLLNAHQHICETSSANLFWVKHNEIFTPHPSTNIVLGTKRQKLLDLSPFKITETLGTIQDLREADEIFLTNASFLIAPVNKFQNKELDNTISQKLLKILQEDLENACKK